MNYLLNCFLSFYFSFSLSLSFLFFFFFFLNDPAPPEISPLPLHAALPISTALRVDPATGDPIAGLCRGWAGADGFRTWTFTCRKAPAIAAALRRVAHLRAAPLHWLFAGARIGAPSANPLVVRLPFAWRRFPYALTTVAAAPRSVPGPFRLLSGTSDQVG